MPRLITGLIAAGIWCLILYIGSFYLVWAAISISAIAAAWEYISITLKDEQRVSKMLITLFGSLPLLLSFSLNLDFIVGGLVTGLIGTCIFTVCLYSKLNNPYNSLIQGGFVSIYVSLCASFLIMVMSFSNGAFLLLLLTAITAASDSGAYFIGIKLGKKKLAPHLSPGKTIAGLLGGLTTGLTAALIIGQLFLPDHSLTGILIASLLVVGLGTIGDLTESIIKRGGKVKDSGSLLPGHGGVLDRFDSLLLSGPLFYYLVYWGVV